MDSLDGTEWDVLLIGTGIQQSLLALALSRSGKKILHLDKNDYYGEAEAAFSLQEAEDFAKKNDTDNAAFTNVSISKTEQVDVQSAAQSLSFSRAYTLALCPQLVYAQSALLKYLVSSKVHKQLEFVAVGSWWVYSAPNKDSSGESERDGQLFKVPSSREDIFTDKVLDFKAKRALTKFLRFIVDYEEQREIWEDYRTRSFAEFLVEQFKVPVTLHPPLLALSLSPQGPNVTTTEFALPRIARHLRSIGRLGPGFGSVIPKWGGMSEVTQVACRACAVGGGVYVLHKDVSSFEKNESGVKVHLAGGDVVTTRWVVGQGLEGSPRSNPANPSSTFSKSITIVSSPLSSLFPSIAEEAPAPACAVVTFPSGSLSFEDGEAELPPVHILVHSADTGECPTGQCVLYASTSLIGQNGFALMKAAVEALLRSVDTIPSPTTLWSMQYEQNPHSISSQLSSVSGIQDHILNFSLPPIDLSFEDAVLDQVKSVWEKLKGDDEGNFLEFENRTPDLDDDEDDV